MTVLEALNRVPKEKWQLQSLQCCFLAGKVGKNGASITFAAPPDMVLQMNAAAVSGEKVKHVGMVIWVETAAWEEAKKEPGTNETKAPVRKTKRSK